MARQSAFEAPINPEVKVRVKDDGESGANFASLSTGGSVPNPLDTQALNRITYALRGLLKVLRTYIIGGLAMGAGAGLTLIGENELESLVGLFVVIGAAIFIAVDSLLAIRDALSKSEP